MQLLTGSPLDTAGLIALYDWPERAEQATSWVRANMASSLDGATAVDGKSSGVSSDNDRALFKALRGLADVVLVGAETVRKEGYGPVQPHADAPPPPLAIVSGSLTGLDPQGRVFTGAARRTILITSATADASAFTDVADIVRAGEDRVVWADALQALSDRGLRKVLTEGGPSILGQLALADRLDEVLLTLSPVLVSGDSKRISAGPVLPDPRRFDLAHQVLDEGTLFLRYVRAARS